MPEYVSKEIQKHTKLIATKANLTSVQLHKLLLYVLSNIQTIPDEQLHEYKDTANNIIGHIDKNDILLVACALHMNGSYIWTDDKHFKKQNIVQTLTTVDIIERIKHL